MTDSMTTAATGGDGIQFVRVDLGEEPAPGSWTRLRAWEEAKHFMTCDFPECVARREAQTQELPTQGAPR